MWLTDVSMLGHRTDGVKTRLNIEASIGVSPGMDDYPIYSYLYVCWVCDYSCYVYSTPVPGYDRAFTVPARPHCECSPMREMGLRETHLVSGEKK